RADDVWLQLREIDFHNLIVIFFRRLIDFRIGHEQLLVHGSEIRQLRPISDVHVGNHLLIEGEDRRSCAQLSAHIANRPLAGRAESSGRGEKVLNFFFPPPPRGGGAKKKGPPLLGKTPPPHLRGGAPPK